MGFFSASKLRKASDTLALEQKKVQLENDYMEHEAFSKSNELRDFYELEKYVLSDGFIKNRKSIEGKSFQKSELYRTEKEFKKYQRSKKFKIYFRLKDSNELSDFETIKDSDEIARYIELEALVKSGNFNKKKQPEEFGEYKTLKKSSRIRAFIKFQKSRPYQTYDKINNSAELEKYFKFEEEIGSDEYQKEKAFLLDKKRFEKTDEFKKLQEYEQLKKSEKFVKYFKLKKSNPFEELKKWELSFSDEFEENTLNREKWITRYYWGDKLLNKGYSLSEDLHTFTDDENISISKSVIKLEAKKEKQKGITWDPTLGFVPQEFDYTSAIISTGKSFRQKYGRFEAKIKIVNPDRVLHSFWMVADKITPHVDIAKTSKNGNLRVGNFWGDEKSPKKNESKLKGIDLNQGYFIYTLDWSANKLVWKINDVVVKKQSKGVPQVPMFLNFSIAVRDKQNDLNAAMEIDWVRCYQKKT